MLVGPHEIIGNLELENRIHRVPSQVQPFNAHQIQLESATLLIIAQWHFCSASG